MTSGRTRLMDTFRIMRLFLRFTQIGGREGSAEAAIKSGGYVVYTLEASIWASLPRKHSNRRSCGPSIWAVTRIRQQRSQADWRASIMAAHPSPGTGRTRSLAMLTLASCSRRSYRQPWRISLARHADRSHLVESGVLKQHHIEARWSGKGVRAGGRGSERRDA